MNPVKYLIDHQEQIMQAYTVGKGPKATWSILEESAPELATAMKYNTFKQYLTPFVMIVREFEERVEKGQGAKKTVAGWTVNQGKDGYFRAVKKIKGRAYCVYLGKEYDKEKAAEKVAAKEKSIV